MHITSLPSQQLSILDRCFNRSGNFIEFEPEDIEQSVSARFETQVRLYPHQLAIKTTRQEITYCQLNRDANRVAHSILGLTEIGEAPVCLLFEQGIHVVSAILGVLKGGRAFVPLDPSFPRSTTSYMVEDSGSNLILTDSTNLSLATELAPNGCRVLNIEDLDPGHPDSNPGMPTIPSALAYLLYTSGSTGQPKGVPHIHRNLLQAAMRPTNVYHICSSDRLTMLYTPSSAAGLRDIFRALLNGAALYPLDLKTEGIGKLFDWLSQNKITIYYSVSTVFRQFISGFDVKDGLPDLRLLILGGEPALKTDVELFKQNFSHECIFINVLASTESTCVRWFFIDHETRIEGDTVPVGYEFSEGIEVLILDDHLEEIGSDGIGQIAIRSRYLPTGYWNRPDLTQAAFLDDPDGGDLRIFLTGDLGQMHEDGCLEHLGRMDFQVKIRGNRVDLSEIENVLTGIDTIRAAAVIPYGQDSSSNQTVIAYFVPFGNASPTTSDLRHILTDELPDYMIPSKFVRMDSLPMLPGGKIDRNALPRPGHGRPNLKNPYAYPTSVIEQVLADIWSQVLEVDQLGLHDDFLDLGGDSLLAAALLVHVEEIFQKNLPLAALIEASTVAQMAKILRNERWTSSGSCLVPIQTKGNKPPFFCIHALGGHVLGMVALARHLGEDQPFYGLESAGRDGEQPPLTEIEAMAARYIKEIQTVQPEGPYLLGGCSMGGVIAFEMAQQLQAEGREVALLAIFDSSCPGVTSSWRRRKDFVLRQILSVPKLLQRNPTTQRRFIGEKVTNRFIPTSPVHRPNIEASRRYKPVPYPGKITFFWASDGPEGPSDPRRGWRELAEQGMAIHRIPGDHGGIRQEPMVQVLAERLNDCLEEALPFEDRTTLSEGNSGLETLGN